MYVDGLGVCGSRFCMFEMASCETGFSAGYGCKMSWLEMVLVWLWLSSARFSGFVRVVGTDRSMSKGMACVGFQGLG